MEAYTRSEQTKSFPRGEKIQNGDTGNHQDIPPTRGVGYFNRLQECLHHIPYTGTVQEISCPGSDIPVQSTTFWSVCNTLGVHCDSKGGETDGHLSGLSFQRFFKQYMQQVTPPSKRPIRHEVQQQVASVSPVLDPLATAVNALSLPREDLDAYAFSPAAYEAKWTIFTMWCLTNQIDFRAPPVNSVADFLMYLFQDRKLSPVSLMVTGQPSAINISKDENLTRLLDSFHRDRPKGQRGIPSWNLSLVLHQLTKAPFEPIKEASLKQLTFKTVFLLALGSGNRRSEIHAWQNRNIRHQSDWSKVSLYLSPRFLSKNQLAKEGPDSVSPVVIPALAPTLNRSLKSDRSLCAVRALRYYFDRTSDIRQNKELVFVSLKKCFDKRHLITCHYLLMDQTNCDTML